MWRTTEGHGKFFGWALGSAKILVSTKLQCRYLRNASIIHWKRWNMDDLSQRSTVWKPLPVYRMAPSARVPTPSIIPNHFPSNLPRNCTHSGARYGSELLEAVWETAITQLSVSMPKAVRLRPLRLAVSGEFSERFGCKTVTGQLDVQKINWVYI